jgi:hypothetical protein
MRLAPFAVFFALLGPFPGSAQESGSPYADTLARRLVEGALSRRQQLMSQGPVRALLSNRVRVGLLIPNQWNWRDRTLFHKQTLGTAWYDAAGGRDQVVLARSRGAPILGDDLIDRPALWDYFGFDPERAQPALFGIIGLSLAGIGQDLPSAESPGIHQVFDSTFVDPLSLMGPETYRYSSGRPLTIARNEPATLLSVEFRPTDPEAGAITGIIWFDAETGHPRRAMIRPHGRWQLKAGLRGLIRSFPLLPKDAAGGMDYLVVDYSRDSEELTWPAVARVLGAMYWFGDQAILPVQIEWEIALNAEPPPASEAQAPKPLRGGWTFSVDRRALNPFIRELDRAVGPPQAPRLGQVLRRAVASVRFNQVQGVNFKVQYPFPVGARTVLEAEVGIPTSSFEVTGGLGLDQEVYPYSWGAEAYSRLKDANWMEVVNGFTSSISAILTGYDDGNYYLAHGGDLWFKYGDRPLDGSVSLFAEHHRKAPKTAGYSLFEPDSLEALPPDLDVDGGNYYGLRGRVDLQLGDDPQKGVLVARVYGQAVTGDRAFGSIGTTTDLVGPLPGPLTGAVRVQIGLADGDLPGQALYYLGGHKTIRGYPANVASGESTLILTGEIGTQIPLIRLLAFADVGWANERGHLFDGDAFPAVGIGISLADGVLRADIARGLGYNGVWRFHLATSGLF